MKDADHKIKFNLMRSFTSSKIFIFSLLLLFPATSFSQQFSLDKRISISINDLTLEEAIDEIAESGKINFSYNPQALPPDVKIRIHADNEPLRLILEELCKQAGLTYELVEQQIILKRSEPEEQTEVMELPENRIYSGFIKDKETGETLIGAAIYIPELKLGTISNAFGFFSLTIPDKIYEMQVSYV